MGNNLIQRILSTHIPPNSPHKQGKGVCVRVLKAPLFSSPTQQVSWEHLPHLFGHWHSQKVASSQQEGHCPGHNRDSEQLWKPACLSHSKQADSALWREKEKKKREKEKCRKEYKWMGCKIVNKRKLKTSKFQLLSENYFTRKPQMVNPNNFWQQKSIQEALLYVKYQVY